MEMQTERTKHGASNIEFDIISEAHCLLKGNAALEQYIEDAKKAGEREVEACFQAIRDQNKQHVDKLRGLLVRCLKTS